MKRYRRKNPGLEAKDLPEKVLPAFGAYAGARFLSRVVRTTTEERFPKWSRHLAAASPVLAAALIYFLGGKVKRLSGYQEEILVGSAIAGLQGIAQTYVPKYGWVTSDYQEKAARPETTVDVDKMLAENDDLEMVPLLSDGEQTPSTDTATETLADEFEEIEFDPSSLGDYSDAHEPLLQ